MQSYWLLILVCLFAMSPVQVKTDEESENEIEGVLGGKLTLVSNVDRFKRCHFVFTEENGSEQCCYHLKDWADDCTDNYAKPNGKRCLKEEEYVMTLDDRRTGTCNLTIESVSGFSAGQYKSYNADDELIQGFVVKVTSGQGQIDSSLIPVIVLAMILFHQGRIAHYVFI